MKSIEDLNKKIEFLEKRISELEKKDNLSIFGRSYTHVGNSNSDFLIKTRGQIKVQWGSKFIDLIKDGKLNVESKILYKINNKQDIPNIEGIYVTDDSEIYLKLKSVDPIQLSSDGGISYVSFLAQQQTNSDAKYTALTNIGFLYKDLDSINSDSLLNGIIYVESELKLYTVVNGELLEFNINFSKSKQFIIEEDNDLKGSLIIEGEGINNSIAFNNMWIYNNSIYSDKPFNIIINGKDVVEISESISNFKNTITSTIFQSPEFSSLSGFKLYISNGRSILEVDLIIERNLNTSPEDWLSYNNILDNITIKEDKIEISLVSSFNYLIGDILSIYNYYNDEWNKYDFKIIELIGDATFIVDGNLDNIEIFKQGDRVFLTESSNCPIRIKNNSISIIKNNSEITKIGEIKEGVFGIYSQNAVFDTAEYSKDLLPLNDNSLKLANTKWVLNFIKTIPNGSIILFSGNDIPNGWEKYEASIELNTLIQNTNLYYIIKK